MTVPNLQSAFSQTGIVPFNPSIFCSKSFVKVNTARPQSRKKRKDVRKMKLFLTEIDENVEKKIEQMSCKPKECIIPKQGGAVTETDFIEKLKWKGEATKPEEKTVKEESRKTCKDISKKKGTLGKDTTPEVVDSQEAGPSRADKGWLTFYDTCSEDMSEYENDEELCVICGLLSPPGFGKTGRVEFLNWTKCDSCYLHHSWEPWTPWSPCSVTCDFGMSLRKRNCSNGDSKTGVTDCIGDASEYRLCNEILCNAVNGEWGAWSTWESCSTTCGTGLQSRQRNCSNPIPSNGGEHCFGETTDYRSCHLTYCSVSDGNWSSWSHWSSCSSTCTKTRTRNCTTYTGGRQCLGNSVDKENCNSAGCALYAQYDCREAQRNGIDTSGVYEIFLRKSKQKIRVYCDMTTDGGGWTVFQNRFNGSVNFYRSFSEYTNGFGTLIGEFWLGLRYIQESTDPADGASELRLDLSAADNSIAYEVFQNFYLSGGDNFTLNIDHGTGTAGDSQGLSYHNRRGFSTYDRDVSGRNCSVKDHGGWWYTNCAFANLNGEYATPGTTSLGEGGMTYRNFKDLESLKTSKMMFRRAGQ